MHSKKIIFLASDCLSSRWVFNYLKNVLPISQAIIETPISKKHLFTRRVKKIGFIKVAGQAMFSLLVVPFLKLRAKKRANELIKMYALDNRPFDNNNCSFITSVNSNECMELLIKSQPDIVIVNGTRIISKQILQCVNSVFINIHTGITPIYRGSHGGYWALYNKDVENFGTTIHVIDTGIDSGPVLKHVFAKPGKADNFTTYPILQVAEGMKALPNVIDDYFTKKNTSATIQLTKGKMYHQPTLWQYFKNSTK